MRRALCLLITMIVGAAAMAQRAQDFASRFMKEHSNDTTIQCVTVSPKMMEQLANSFDESRNATLRLAIGKLKSARIVTAAENYFDDAEELLRQNAARFTFEKGYTRGQQHGAFYERKNRKGNTVELIMLHADNRLGRLTIINLTGNLDKDFISSLMHSFNWQDTITETSTMN